MSAPQPATPAPLVLDTAYLEFVGGDDPDFSPNTDTLPVVCTIPGLKSVLPQCR